MAREESSREDLLREATALAERIELQITGSMSAALAGDRHIVVGFRSNGSASFFFGEDPVYQFNSTGQLRRAYRGGMLFKAARGRLVSLQRVRQQHEVQLLSRQLPDAEQTAFIHQMCESLRGLAEELAAGRFEVIGQASSGMDLLGRVRGWLATHNGTPIATSPRAV